MRRRLTGRRGEACGPDAVVAARRSGPVATVGGAHVAGLPWRLGPRPGGPIGRAAGTCPARLRSGSRTRPGARLRTGLRTGIRTRPRTGPGVELRTGPRRTGTRATRPAGVRRAAFRPAIATGGEALRLAAELAAPLATAVGTRAGTAAGAGVALIPSFLIRPELEAGTLVVPFARPMSSEQAYYLVYPPEALANPAVAQFRNWMLEQAGARAVTSASRSNPRPPP